MSPWHAPHDLLVRYAIEPEHVAHVDATSVETHLVSCAVCRAVVADHVDAGWLEQSWLALADVVDRPKRTLGERMLGLFASEGVARVVASTRSLRWAWVTAVALISGVLGLVAHDRGEITPFLLIGPGLPLLGVGLAFHPVPDPAGEAALATPMYGAGMVLRRSAAVLTTTLLVMAPAAALLPNVDWWAVAWLLPAVALTSLAVGLCTWMAPNLAVGVVAMGWITAVYVASIGALPSHARFVDLVFGPRAQLAWLTIAVVAATTIATRRDRFSMLEAR